MTTPPEAGKGPAEPEALDFGPLHDMIARNAIENFKKDGRIYSSIQFLLLARPIKRQPMPARAQALDPRLTHEFMSTREGRDRLGQFLRDALTAGTPTRTSMARSIGFEPDVILQLDEAWAARATTMEEATRTAPSQRADRQEVVMIALHHRWGGTITNTLPIIELPQRHLKFEPLPKGLIATLGPMAMTPSTRA